MNYKLAFAPPYIWKHPNPPIVNNTTDKIQTKKIKYWVFLLKRRVLLMSEIM